MKKLLIVIVVGFVVGLVYYVTRDEVNPVDDETWHEEKEMQIIERDPEYDTLSSFLGKSIVLNNSVYDQIAAIAREDKMLSYGDSVLRIGKVRWRINYHEGKNSIMLMSSVEPDAPKMGPIIGYLKKIYGMPYAEDEVFDIKWSSSNDSSDVYKPGCTMVHLRRVRSDEGGTMIIFE